METPNEENKRYRRQMLIWAITYCLVTFASVYTLKNAGIENVRQLVGKHSDEQDQIKGIGADSAVAIAKAVQEYVRFVHSHGPALPKPELRAASDLQLANERTTGLESSVTRLAAAVSDYLRQAVVSDPDARLRVETSLRELDAVLGLRQKPRPDVRTGSLQQARIVSLDQDSGMLVLNIGESQGARIGMTFRLTRGQQPYGTAILADVRKGVSGIFVESLDETADTPRPGDLAILETQAIGK